MISLKYSAPLQILQQCHCGAIGAHQAIVKACHGAHQGIKRAHQVTIKAHHGSVEAHHGAIMTHYGSIEAENGTHKSAAFSP
jgi:hypothetical protein